MLDAIGIAMLGTDLNTLRKKNRMMELYEAVTSAEPSVQAVFMATALLPSWISKRLPGSAARRLTVAGSELRKECMKQVKQARITARELDGDAFLLDLVKSAEFTDDQLVDQLLLIIGAGYEPTSAAFSWTVWLLATHPAWQKQLREEIQAKFSASHFRNEEEGGIIPEDLENLPILHAVCNEALRFMPTTPITTRVSSEDSVILGHHIPKNTRIYIVPYACNRSTAFYGPTADVFDPGRWIDANGKSNNNGGADSNYAFMTFLHGPRKCIGDGYAKIALRVFVAAFVGAFRFEIADSTEVPIPGGMLVTKPVNGLQLKLQSSNWKRTGRIIQPNIAEDEFKLWESDPKNPQNWPSPRKWTTVVVVGWLQFLSPLASVMLAPSLPQIAKDLHITSSSLLTFTMSIYLLGSAGSAMLAAPLSEVFGYGRRI
ncbi:hypothetical protein TI39_contig308g00010 [Zymoseptoria brevis]|uniref:Major facilitator superfamily (MFS) profile domain-containing protein n=1 Tax=Zymoseptoria brevis TaxID=1047168 RepID=A0A0F4GUG3_9PEZI|nr:hypothetical protein TI39_contig308g00010 [Zymoseptoria brevis]